MDKLFLLSQISLLDELPMEELHIIDQISEMKPVKKGTLILSPDKKIEALFLLKKGQVRLYRMNARGKQFTVDILVDGNIFGETSTLSLTDDQIYAEAMTDTYLCLLGKKEFETFIEKNPKIALKLIHILSTRLKELYSLSEKIALSDVKYRILYLLLKLSEKTGKRKKEWQTIGMKLTHQDIASMVGASRETTSAVMSQLKRDGFIKKGIHLAIHVEKALELLDY
ncbi:Crp/Fnr family transcriptional regulator [Anoxybacillus sp. LAT_35]|uniref:Crp/Fnr family transcriptional regulator n=1 Tax=Anoxybacillus TaxID=150247 RepID=UPI001EDC405C|nr:Crp/Fnr family transcriptional regulator [Anoxybacillus sp. LAT_26]MCG3084344.1 Crp/Fnr family transcriptional regulator [Anoxybacillus sp. LAT27]MCG5026345.1 Crp/Fnr family transcriptional regulator [Anoxybacillus flavithermus]MCG6170997.1 Crp/Fnr family transcriptional regulator [Anoxybacillus sp. LAT_11]MCG6176047.1 Crp/Fnr family transcriptional regulator [Anoxybacillus sp. LAT_31]MCG6178320.1 Crp/Fnr family transcriptional regulator [Anoxybacillus sp. LAT_35]MCG6181077.1 Crp/Fnr famil